MGSYTKTERIWLWAMGLTCAVGLNGAFLYGLTRPAILHDALTNPVAVAFIVEGFLLMAALAWLLQRNGLTRIAWPWFVLLSLLGGLAFALPVALLWRGKSPSAR